MLVHYLVVAVATHRARPVTTLVSALTLALGFFCFLTAYGVVAFWERAERHFPTADRTFVVTSQWQMREARDGGELRSGVVPRTNACGEWWLDQALVTYVLLPADRSLTAEALRGALPAFVERHVPADQIKAASIELGLVPVTEVLGMALDGSLFLNRSGVSFTAILLALGSLVLGVACLDFANLATARALRRAREVGMRKTLGATARQVLAQHLLEAGALAAVALAVALAGTALLAPAIEAATGIDPRLPLLSEGAPWGVLAAALLAVTLASGLYPAAISSRFPPLTALSQGQLHSGPRSLGAWLAGMQFAGAAFLLIAVAVVQAQNERLERTGLAVADAQLLVIDNDAEMTGLRHATLRAALLELPQVRAATQLAMPPWTTPAGMMPLTTAPDSGYAIERSAMLHIVGEDFFETFAVPLVAGRSFDPLRADDVAAVGRRPTATQNLVISRALARELGFDSPAAAVGSMLYIPQGAAPPSRFQIIGVVDDKPINISSGYGPRPVAYLFHPEQRYHVVRIAPGEVAQALAAIDALWKRMVPDVVISRRFADDYFNDAYQNFVRLDRAFLALSLAALLIAASGLCAMALLSVRRRLHEIGVRKTCGASSAQIVGLLLGGFSRPVLLANVIAWPFAYIAARAYLNLFIDPAPLMPLPFVAALAATGLAALVAVGVQTVRAARTVPGQMLRQE